MVAFFCSFEISFRNHKYHVMRQICFIIQLFFCFSINAQQNIGYVNYKQLLDTLPSHNETIKKLEDFKTNGMNELQEMQKEFEQIYFRWANNKTTCNELYLKEEQNKLRKIQQDIKVREGELEQGLKVYNEELIKPILDRIQKAIEIVAERKKLSYVIDEAGTLYFKGGIDCTAEVIIELLKLDEEAMKK